MHSMSLKIVSKLVRLLRFILAFFRRLVPSRLGGDGSVILPDNARPPSKVSGPRTCLAEDAGHGDTEPLEDRGRSTDPPTDRSIEEIVRRDETPSLAGDNVPSSVDPAVHVPAQRTEGPEIPLPTSDRHHDAPESNIPVGQRGTWHGRRYEFVPNDPSLTWRYNENFRM